MMPSSSDIFEHNVADFATVAKKIVDAGHFLLIVSKPRIACIQHLCAELERWKTSVLFRFTIGTLDQGVASAWEPNAPFIAERIECLKYAFDHGYRTSISMEPLLGDPRPVVEALYDFVTDDIWIGVMTARSSWINDIEDCHVKKLDEDTFHRVREYVDALKNDQKIFWKDSIFDFYV